MSFLQIKMKVLTYNNDPDNILKKTSTPVEHFDSELKNTVQALKDTLTYEDQKQEGISAVGLAAPQLGISKNIFLTNLNKKIQVFINPKIKNFGKEKNFTEGCLSFPGLYVPVTRPSDVKIKYYDEQGKKQKTRASEFLARIIQHEYDHLIGKILADQKAFKIAKQLAKQQNQDIKTIINNMYAEQN